MKLEITHETRYRYSSPVRESLMELWLQPLALGRQRLVSFEVVTRPRAKLFSRHDWLGNVVYHFDVPEEHEALTIRTRAAVQTEAPPSIPDRVDAGDWMRLNEQETLGRFWDFLHPSHFACDSPLLNAFMQRHGLTRGPDPLTTLHDLNNVIHQSFAFQPGVTAADSPIDKALQEGAGVCQDFAHIMLAVARRLGIPARYVSGYVARGTAGEAARERSTSEASHSWVECWVPEVGWIGFDPSNNMLAGERHVIVAYGRDYADVPPTRGVLKGDAETKLEVEVRVSRARADTRESDFLREVRPARARPAGVAVPGEELAQTQQQ